jgi:lipoprotein NlpD
MRVIALALAAALGSACTPGRWQAPVEDRRPPPRAAAPAAKPAPVTVQASPEGTYVVKRGDTLYSIALEHGADYRDVAQWNALDDPGRLRAGQVLRMKPPPAQQGVTLGTAPSIGRVESRPLEGQKPVAPEAKPAAREEPKLEAQPLQFTWPAKGKVLAGFAEPRHKGIDIEGRIGDPVIAAAAGRVTYVGSGIPGLGKLVVIRHDQGYITVYAHNKDILVKEQQSVTRGQRIAELGNTDADRPKLHFQIRKGSAAVDPLLYLPKS